MKILLLALFLIPLFACCQTLPVKDGMIEYEFTDTLSGLRDDSFRSAKLWLVNAFKDSRQVIQFEDRENGELIGKGNMIFLYRTFLSKSEAICDFNIQIFIRDRRYKARFYNISTFTGYRHYFSTMEDWFKNPDNHTSKIIIKEVDDRMKSFIQSLKTAMHHTETDDFR